MTAYRPDVRCPTCRRCPNVRFTEREVQRAKRERQAAHVMSVHCPRCPTRYWIKARDIARATLEPGPELSQDFPGRDELTRAGLRTIEEVLRVSDLTEIPGIGPATARRIRLKLDTMAGQAVA